MSPRCVRRSSRSSHASARSRAVRSRSAQALRDLGLKSDLAAEVPTTAGIIAALQPLAYPALKATTSACSCMAMIPNRPLVEFLAQLRSGRRERGSLIATADSTDDAAVLELLGNLEPPRHRCHGLHQHPAGGAAAGRGGWRSRA